MSYKGKDRRVHTCFITRNREYHVRAGEVMAVRDRKTRIWIAGHQAIGMRLKPQPKGVPYIGRALELYCTVRQAVMKTSPVVDIIRPGRNEVDFYGFVHGFAPIEEMVS